MNTKPSTLPRIEENPPYQRINAKRRAEAERGARVADAVKKATKNQDNALLKWANVIK